MPTLESPCFLLPHGSERSTVYVCIPVDRDLAAKSPVLETLMEYEGLVDMPEGVSFEDFEAWSTMATQQPSTFSVDELSFALQALQVGEKLSAQNISELTGVLAARLKATCWSARTDPNPMLRAFLTLSKNLQQLVFDQLDKMSPPAILAWPTPLQQACADRWVSPVHGSSTAAFKMPNTHRPASILLILELLSRTDPSLQGLTSLAVECSIPSLAAASLLSSALLHHPALEHLDMPRLSWEPCGPSTPATAVFRTLPQLTAITRLTLSAPSLPPSPPQPSTAQAAVEAVHAMAAAVSALPSLAQFHLTTVESSTGGTSPAAALPPAPKRRKIARSMGSTWSAFQRPSLEPIIAALSTVPALTSLTLSIPACNLSKPLASSGPFSSLQRLFLNISEGMAGGVHEGEGSIETGVLSSVSLPALATLQYRSRSPDCAAHRACIRNIVAHASSQPALERADMRLVAADEASTPTASFYFCIDDNTSGRGLTLDVAPCLTAGIAESLCNGLSSLTTRDLFQICVGSYGSDESQEELLQGIEHVQLVLQCLHSFTLLEGLQFFVHVTPSLYGSQVRDLCSAFLAAPLSSLTQLTSLSLVMPAACGVRLSQLAGILTEVPLLRDLALQHFDNVGVRDFDCFAPLTALACLILSVRPVTAELLQAFACVVRRNLSLESACIGSFWCTGSTGEGSDEGQAAVQGDWDSWCQAYLSLPPRGCFDVPLSSTLALELEVKALSEQLAARGACVHIESSSLRIDYGKAGTPALLL